MGNAGRFWDWIADRYARQAVPDEASYRDKLARTRRYFHPSMDVLEIGCGTGSTAIAHAPYVGRVEGIDVSARMVAIARDRAAAQRVDNVTFVQRAFGEPPEPAVARDAVLALNFLHLVPDWRTVLQRVLGLLRPGGVFVTSTACIGDMGLGLRFIARVVRALPGLPEPQLIHEDALVHAMQEVGFEIAERWRPRRHAATFIVARVPGAGTARPPAS